MRHELTGHISAFAPAKPTQHVDENSCVARPRRWIAPMASHPLNTRFVASQASAYPSRNLGGIVTKCALMPVEPAVSVETPTKYPTPFVGATRIGPDRDHPAALDRHGRPRLHVVLGSFAE